jgi:multidrug resistance efflux pump
LLGAAIVLAAVIAVGVTLLQWETRPQTDDATVRANFVGIAPQVEFSGSARSAPLSACPERSS